MNKNKHFDTMMATYAMMMLSTGMSMGDNTLHNGSEHIYHDWDIINLTKQERKGKTYEELQAIRKEKWEAVH